MVIQGGTMSATFTRPGVWGRRVLSAALAAAALWAGIGAIDSPGPAVGGAEPGDGPGFKPVPLPDPKVPGFVFPEKEAVIVEWTEKDNQQAINRHGWGIWTALTLPSGEKFDG